MYVCACVCVGIEERERACMLERKRSDVHMRRPFKGRRWEYIIWGHHIRDEWLSLYGF